MSEKKLEGWQKILPNQGFNCDQYRGSEPFEKALYETILAVSGIKSPTEKFTIEQTDMFTIEEMASSPMVLGFLQWLIEVAGVRRILEIGTFVGVSSMYMAEALPEGSELITIEKFDHFADIARKNFSNNGFDGIINVIQGDAAEMIRDLDPAKPFDLVFIDGNKERYAEYFDEVAPLVRPGGIVVTDDALFHGDALNPSPESDKGKGVKAFLSRAAAATDWRRSLIPISNGIVVMRKPAT